RDRQSRRGRCARAGQRKGPRARDGAGRSGRGGAPEAHPRGSVRAGAHRGQDDPKNRGGQGTAGLNRHMRTALRFLCVLCVLCGAVSGSGCGYALAGRGSTLPASIKTIGIPQFTNRTTVFNLETTLTMKVRSEFIGRGKWEV